MSPSAGLQPFCIVIGALLACGVGMAMSPSAGLQLESAATGDYALDVGMAMSPSAGLQLLFTEADPSHMRVGMAMSPSAGLQHLSGNDENTAEGGRNGDEPERGIATFHLRTSTTFSQ